MPVNPVTVAEVPARARLTEPPEPAPTATVPLSAGLAPLT